MSTLTITAPVVLSPGCGCEQACFVPLASGTSAKCSKCDWSASLRRDIVPHLEEGERLVWITGLIRDSKGNTYDGMVLSYFTEETDNEEED